MSKTDLVNAVREEVRRRNDEICFLREAMRKAVEKICLHDYTDLDDLHIELRDLLSNARAASMSRLEDL